MSPFDDRHLDWKRRAERYRQWSRLLDQHDEGLPLRRLALELEQSAETRRALTASHDEMMRQRAVLWEEIDRLVARVRGAWLYSAYYLEPYPFSADDLREEARLCQEEATATDDAETCRCFADCGTELAQFAELAGRHETGNCRA